MLLRCFQHCVTRAGLLVVLAGFLSVSNPLWAQRSPFPPYQHRALYLYNFAKFTTWPTNKFSDAEAPFVLGILGKDPFGEDIDIIRGKPLKDRAVVVRRYGRVEEVENCDLLFISESERNRLVEILRALEGSSVLTVAEMEGFIEAGGMINLLMEKKKIRFDINLVAAHRAGLKLDSQFSRLARRVKAREEGEK